MSGKKEENESRRSSDKFLAHFCPLFVRTNFSHCSHMLSPNRLRVP